jgi:hypothetical protein
MNAKQLGWTAVALILLPSSPSFAQEYKCESMVIQKTLTRSIQTKAGPSAADRLQVIASTGRDIIITVDYMNIQTTGTAPGNVSCTARVRIFREDTNETYEAIATYRIVNNTTVSLISHNRS